MENIENRELFQYDLNTVKGNRVAWDNKKKKSKNVFIVTKSLSS